MAFGIAASAMIYSLLESAKVNGHTVYRHMAVILSELTNATSPEHIKSLLPWNLTTEQVNDRHATFPALWQHSLADESQPYCGWGG